MNFSNMTMNQILLLVAIVSVLALFLGYKIISNKRNDRVTEALDSWPAGITESLKANNVDLLTEALDSWPARIIEALKANNVDLLKEYAQALESYLTPPPDLIGGPTNEVVPGIFSAYVVSPLRAYASHIDTDVSLSLFENMLGKRGKILWKNNSDLWQKAMNLQDAQDSSMDDATYLGIKDLELKEIVRMHYLRVDGRYYGSHNVARAERS